MDFQQRKVRWEYKLPQMIFSRTILSRILSRMIFSTAGQALQEVSDPCGKSIYSLLMHGATCRCDRIFILKAAFQFPCAMIESLGSVFDQVGFPARS